MNKYDKYKKLSRQHHIIHHSSPPVSVDCPIHGVSHVVTMRYVNELGTNIMMCGKCAFDICNNMIKEGRTNMEFKFNDDVPPPITEDMKK